MEKKFFNGNTECCRSKQMRILKQERVWCGLVRSGGGVCGGVCVVVVRVGRREDMEC